MYCLLLLLLLLLLFPKRYPMTSTMIYLKFHSNFQQFYPEESLQQISTWFQRELKMDG